MIPTGMNSSPPHECERGAGEDQLGTVDEVGLSSNQATDQQGSSDHRDSGTDQTERAAASCPAGEHGEADGERYDTEDCGEDHPPVAS